MTPVELFIWGAVGGVAPEVLRLYRIVTAGDRLPRLRWPYFLISVIFMVVAGLVTMAWSPENRLKAIWVGASTPLIISAFVQAVPRAAVGP